MAISSRLTEALGLSVPIILAPMAGVSGGALASAVSVAGGFGFLAAGYLATDDVLRELDLAGETPVGVGFITWRALQDRSTFDRVIKRRPAAIFLSFGDATDLAPAVTQVGAKLFMQVQTVEGARAAAGQGADVIVVQGTEAGGHGAQRSLGPLLDDIVEADLGPIIVAAGGIGTGRALASVLVRGAEGGLCGTAFYAATESLAHPNAKQRATGMDGASTERTDLFDAARGLDWPAPWTLRAGRNHFSATWRNAAKFRQAGPHERAVFAEALGAGNFDVAPLIVGEGVGNVRQVEPAAEIMKRMQTGAEAALRDVSKLLRPGKDLQDD
ncbi:NAD(P)H-dependent flavin oxidoreductase [Erythrobacter mangrovi]|uniref:Nitronate monooxygenase n=1 Tax=Erythrobacter mangrovi TaxID=2739433 RepID=A0A7D3XAJ7_9SPHN|nr:nitronate monooxygenase [Erythrobacter mangrovi]QKG70640.1 nitronate monooxygenase [Erythrobacter mangrovi]